jgi:hypothetical protein
MAMDQPGLRGLNDTRRGPRPRGFGSGLRITRRAALLTPVLAAFGAASSQAEWDGIERIVAIGDVHGDCDALIAVLKMSGLVNENASWVGGKAHLVQIGDLPARGTQTRKAMDYLMKLEVEADAAGGRVHALIGNHDAMVMYGDLRTILPEEYGEFRTADSEATLQATYEKYVAEAKQHGKYPATAEDQESFRKAWFDRHPPGFAEHRAAFSADGKYGSWIRGHNAIIRVNDTLFVHGGISPEFAGTTISAINEKIRSELADPTKLPPGLTTNIQGPLWYRGLADADQKELGPHVQLLLKTFKVRRIVIGHTVTRSAILPRFNSAVVNIDLGLSRFFGRPPACLDLDKGTVSILHNSKRFPLPASHQEVLAYLRSVASVDPAPEMIEKAISKIEGNRARRVRRREGENC